MISVKKVQLSSLSFFSLRKLTAGFFLFSLVQVHQSWGAATKSEAKVLPSGAVELGGDFTKIAISGPSWSVYYGAKDNYFILTGSGRTPLACEPGTFGGDPMPNVAKKCYFVPQCDPETKDPKPARNVTMLVRKLPLQSHVLEITKTVPIMVMESFYMVFSEAENFLAKKFLEKDRLLVLLQPSEPILHRMFQKIATISQ